MGYEVHTEAFAGPFDLLLHLILKQEVDLWEISLSTIVDAYLNEVERLGAMDLDVATEFLLIAATLIELKARRLLPGAQDVELDEELLRFEERDLLLSRLLECKTFKDAAQSLERMGRLAGRSFPRRAGPEEPFRSLQPDPLSAVLPNALLQAAIRAFTPKPEPDGMVRLDHVAPIRASVRDAVETVLALLPEIDSMSFRDLVHGVDDRLEIIVRFLAVLELYKQGVVDLEQISNFGALQIRRLAEGEGIALDAASLDDWNDEPIDLHDDEPVEVS